MLPLTPDYAPALAELRSIAELEHSIRVANRLGRCELTARLEAERTPRVNALVRAEGLTLLVPLNLRDRDLALRCLGLDQDLMTLPVDYWDLAYHRDQHPAPDGVDPLAAFIRHTRAFWLKLPPEATPDHRIVDYIYVNPGAPDGPRYLETVFIKEVSHV